MTNTAAPRRSTPASQSVWLTIYWIAAVINSWLMIQAITSAAVLRLPAIVAVILACISTVVGAVFATRILRRGVSTTIFVKSTTTVRVIAIAWIVLEIAIVSTAVISTFTQLDISELDWSEGFAGAVGSISLLAVLGPGYSEYREAMAPSSS